MATVLSLGPAAWARATAVPTRIAKRASSAVNRTARNFTLMLTSLLTVAREQAEIEISQYEIFHQDTFLIFLSDTIIALVLHPPYKPFVAQLGLFWLVAAQQVQMESNLKETCLPIIGTGGAVQFVTTTG